MEVLFAMLMLPFLGGAMLLLDWHRKSGMDRDAREFGRRMLAFLGWVTLLHGLAFACWTATRLVVDLGSISNSLYVLINLARSALIAGLTFAGWAAICAGRHDERDDLDLSVQYRRQLESERLWAAELVLIGLPLLIPGATLLFIFLGVIGLIEFTTAFPRQSRTNRLLWTLSLAASNGRPFQEEVNFLSERERSVVWKARYLKLVNDLIAGDSLTTALMPHARYLPNYVLPAIAVAEEQGTLRQALSEMALRHTREIDRNRSGQDIAGVIFLLWIMLMVLINITGFICYWIVPKFKAIFNDFGVELPRITVFFINVADAFVNYWYLLLPLLSVPILALMALHGLTSGAAQGRTGFLSRFFPRLDTPSILRTLALTIQHHAQLPRALDLMGQLHRIPQQQMRLHRVESRVAKIGDSIGDALWDEGFLTSRQAHAVTQAGRMDQLPWSLRALADQIDRRRLNAFAWIIELARPLAVLVIALFVLFFCVAMYSPLVKLLNELS